MNFLKFLLEHNSNSITSLELIINSEIDGDLEFLTKLPNLRTFQFHSKIYLNYSVGVGVVLRTIILYLLRRLQSLETLILYNVHENDLDTLIQETKKLPLLKNLKLESFQYEIKSSYEEDKEEQADGFFYTDEVLSKEIPYLTKFSCLIYSRMAFRATVLQPHLTELKFRVYKDFLLLNLDFSILFKNCPFIEVFEFIYEHEVNAEFLKEISKGWTKLNTLYLGVPGISLQEESTCIVFPTLTKLTLYNFVNLSKFFRVVRAPKLLHLKIDRDISNEYEFDGEEFYNIQHNIDMLDNLKTLDISLFMFHGSFPNAYFLKMEMDADADVLLFLKGLQSKSLNFQLELYDTKDIAGIEIAESNIMKLFHEIKDELNLTMYSSYSNTSVPILNFVKCILVKDGFRLFIKYSYRKPERK